MGYLSSNNETRIQRASSLYLWQITGYPDSDFCGIIHLLDSNAMIVFLNKSGYLVISFTSQGEVCLCA